MTIEAWSLILLTIWGACVGSFLNVVIYRVPAGLSVISPPSRCPGCGKKLAWYDNIPVLGWLWLRGRCRYCGMKISIQYPLVEAATALLFFGMTYAYYFTPLRETFRGPGVVDTWPVLAVHLVLLSCMIAATMIDAKLFIIPLRIPYLAAAVAIVVLPASVALGWMPTWTLEQRDWWEELIPATNAQGLAAAVGGMLGLGVAFVLLRLKKLPVSYADEEDWFKEQGVDLDNTNPNDWPRYPYVRREMGKEALYLLCPAVGLIVGALVGANVTATLPPWLSTLGGVLLGYLMGGGLVWGTRVLGSFVLNKEAMGLGDVPLLAAIGTVVGWRDVTLVFFLAPFFGILAFILGAGVAAIVKQRHRAIPYGPYLCGAALVVMVWRTPILAALFP